VVHPGLTWVLVLEVAIGLVFLGIGMLLFFVSTGRVRRRRRRRSAALATG
jgi:hypothetical protein